MSTLPEPRLSIAVGLYLPLEAVTQTFSILAMRGRGKTYTGSVMVEEMVEAGQPVVVIDPTGAWWGLRSSADGKKAGLPVVILGGKHADVPLESTGGRMLADLMVSDPFPCVIDLTGFDSKAEEIRFMTDFLTRLYRKNTEPLHLMIDEADEFAPQQSFPEGKRLLGAMEQIVRRGRLKGLGCTLITQRPAVLNKNVLSQTETLILLGMTGSHDIKAMDDWVGKHSTDPEQGRSIKDSLPGLPIGTAWVWSPSWLGITKKVKVRKRRTFDSSATPKVGQRRIEPRVMADVDLASLRDQMRATIEKAEAEDPKALRQTISQLRRELELERSRPPAAAEPERIKVPMLDDDDRMVMTEMAQTLDKVLSAVEGGYQGPPPLAFPPPKQQVPPAAPRPPRPPSNASGGEPMGKAHMLILSTLAQHGTLTTKQIAMMTGYSGKSSGFKNALSNCRTSGWIEGAGTGSSTITPEGFAALGEFTPLPTGDALFKWWVNRGSPIGKAEAAILDVLRRQHPQFLSSAALAELTGYSAASSGFKNAMSKLRTLGLAEGTGGLKLADELVGG